VHDYLKLWNWDGTRERVHHALYGAVREQAGREASPTAAIIDSQSAKGAQKGAPPFRQVGFPMMMAKRVIRSPSAVDHPQDAAAAQTDQRESESC
jgi:hypothetical protein